MSQLQIEFDTDTSVLQLNQLSPGSIFRFEGGKTVFMKVKSIEFLNNSNILSDVFSRGDCLVINFTAGTLMVRKGTAKVLRLHGNLKVRDE